MKNKIMTLLIFGFLISFSALSQTTENSVSHPKLDAFRKLKENSRSAAPSDPASTPEASPVTSTDNIKSNTQPTSSNIIDNNSTISNSSPLTITPQPVTENNTTIADNPVSQTQPLQTVQAKPEQNKMYNDTRLGSSTKQYDTYEKNNYGAGSVTTSPK